jgi:hypothetical protein
MRGRQRPERAEAAVKRPNQADGAAEVVPVTKRGEVTGARRLRSGVPGGGHRRGGEVTRD